VGIERVLSAERAELRALRGRFVMGSEMGMRGMLGEISKYAMSCLVSR
jgi:hypothetical protein